MIIEVALLHLFPSWTPAHGMLWSPSRARVSRARKTATFR